MSHTPGPWAIHPLDRRAVVAADGNSVIADVTNWRDTTDARLIAAAPELLEALYRIAAIRDKMEGGDWDEITEARAIAVDAIAKAEGQ